MATWPHALGLHIVVAEVCFTEDKKSKGKEKGDQDRYISTGHALSASLSRPCLLSFTTSQ